MPCLVICWLLLLGLLVILASEDFVTSAIRFQQKKETAEALLRFPVIHSLADPCHFQSDIFDSEDRNASPAPMRDFLHFLSGYGGIPLRTIGFIRPHLGEFTKLLDLNDAMREESEQSSLTKEFQLVVSQTLHLIHSIYSPSALRKCDGYQLESLPREKLFVLSSTEGPQLHELYRILTTVEAHLHVIIHDVHDSGRLCPSESLAHLQILWQLIGKVETSMCLVLHSAKREEQVDYLRIPHQVLQTVIHRYHHCSAREVRECLVMNYTSAVFGFVQRYLDYNFDS
ncbi:hypothetical protein DAPPUDRAFT_320628 [Daphnia pulex]|uniref:Uncharacterized protein n=1 Tax=Daphnia pulex TaxID=6669 RepID=E9GQP2_DAPPU|nr:hypothetical protein DAPPUDRAFT_320628 [Daphnia pulex]|eukprot:EFX78148.1 hypothetical protein DAPPUDRAFT_320628 [Daphnia pulex]